MPLHPNILGPPQSLVSTTTPGSDRPTICGSVYPLDSHGTLADKIMASNAVGERIPLRTKAKWRLQMTAALVHTHTVAKTFHMDFKPGNFLVNNDADPVPIDWEKSDAAVTIAAPEIDGTWDAEEIDIKDSDGSCLLAFGTLNTRARNEETCQRARRATKGWNIWSPFIVWQKTCPKASETAEVFSLGRSLWMLLRQCDFDSFEDVKTTLDIMEDWDNSEDIPVTWKHAVEAC